MGDVVIPDENTVEVVRRMMQYSYPVLLLGVFICVGAADSVIRAISKAHVIPATVTGPGGKPLPVTKVKKARKGADGFDGRSRAFFQCCMVLATLSWFAAGGLIACRALLNRVNGHHGWWCGQSKTVHVLASAFLYLYLALTLFDWKHSPCLVHVVIWVVALVADLIILVADSISLSGEHRLMVDLESNKFIMVKGANKWDVIDLALAATRTLLLACLLLVYCAIAQSHLRAQHDKLETDWASDQDTPLLEAEHSAGAGAGAHHGTMDMENGGPDAPTVDADAAFYRQEKLPDTSWFEYLQSYTIFFPYMWPSKQRRLQLVVVLCFLLLALQRVLNIMVPNQIATVTNQLSDDYDDDGRVRMPWQSLGLLVLYKLLQGNSGLLGSWRALLWIPVSQHTYRALTQSAFEHVHTLSLDFHLGKRTGEVLSALNKGSSVNNFLEQITFQVVPMLIDLLVAISYFYWRFDVTYAVLVSIITFYYLFLTIRMAQNTAESRRLMSNADREEEAIKNDSITSYETVKYFNAEEYEFDRYRQALENFQAAEAKVTWSISTMNICQSLIFMAGLLVAMMFGAYQVSQGQRKVGDFVALMTYLNQMQGPLNYFGSFYRTVQQAMISGERLLELFKQRPTVVDRPGAAEVTSCKGDVKFHKVEFAYDGRRPALRDLSFHCRAGTTTALVGESGGGKSTLFRLMYRYFNCQSGSISIDGRDVKDVTIDSIRRFIGVVPQDTILFNETLMYNLQYANPSASEQEIYAACQAASIHDRIMSFPDRYHTKVGERGLRLSGGEKQRVAIARTLLKKPRIIMLDEATSALDSHTEQEIQSRLASIGHGRTLLIIAHRLSTITHADQILVLKHGRIVEKGSHEQLLADPLSVYASMWHRQAKEKAEQQ